MRFHSILHALAVVVSLAGVLAGCGGDKGENPGGSAKKKNKRDKLVIEQPPDLSERVEVLSGGAQTKLVWAWHQNQKSADTYAVGNQHVLVGIDTRDGRGVRVILPERDNYSRPMISEQGKWILFTDKDVVRNDAKEKVYSPVVYKVDWEGKEKTELAKGLALDTWVDRKTGIQWVYALRDLKTSARAAIFGSHLFRFQLENPDIVEEVWLDQELTADNFQLSRDGTKVGALFPWPVAGIGDLSQKSVTKTVNGCWTSTAPDDSYVTWVFDGRHRNLRMFADNGDRSWEIDISKISGIDGHEVYHPRWSNHARYFTITGPYIHEKKNENAISKGGLEAEVYLVKFNDDYDGVEGWVKLSANATGDVYPDAWISTGDESYVSLPAPKVEVVDQNQFAWPVDENGVIFKWENAKSENTLSSDEESQKRICRFFPRRLGRYYSDHDMCLDGAHFEADDASNEVIAGACAASGEVSIEGIFTESHFGDPSELETVLLSYASGEDVAFSLTRIRHELTFQVRLGGREGTGGREYSINLGPLHIENERPFHFVATISGNRFTWYLDGSYIAENVYDHSGVGGWMPGRLVAGDPDPVNADGWSGRLEGVAIYDRALQQQEVRANYLVVRQKTGARQNNRKLRLRAKLVEATPLPTPGAIDPYPRALVDYTYEVDEIISGRYDKPKIVVLHWAVLDRKPAPGVPRQVGQTYELLLESFADHVQLKSERTESGTSEFDLPLYYDATTPGTDPTITDPDD